MKVYTMTYILAQVQIHHSWGIGPYPATQTRITYDIDKLDYNTQYYWRIDEWDSHGYSTTGDTWNFKTQIITKIHQINLKNHLVPHPEKLE